MAPRLFRNFVPSKIHRVDAAANARPHFLSPELAAAQAVAGEIVEIYPGTYTLTSACVFAPGVHVLTHPGVIVQTSTLPVLAYLGAGCILSGDGKWINTRNHADGGIALMPGSDDVTGALIRGGYFEGTAWGIDGDASHRWGTGTIFDAVRAHGAVAGLVAGANYGGARIRAAGNVVLRQFRGTASRPSGTGAVTAISGVYRWTNSLRTNRIDYDDVVGEATSAVLATSAAGHTLNGVGTGYKHGRGFAEHTALGSAWGVNDTGSTTDKHDSRWRDSDFVGLATGGSGIGLRVRSSGELSGGDDKRYYNCSAYGTTKDVDADVTALGEGGGSKIWFFDLKYQSYTCPTTGSSASVKRREAKRPIAIATDDVGNVGGGEDDLHSLSIDGGTWAVKGDTVEFRHEIKTNNHLGGTIRVRAYIGATAVFDSTALTLSASNPIVLTIAVTRLTATTAQVSADWSLAGTTAQQSRTQYTALTGLDFTAAIVEKITGEHGGSTTDSVVARKSVAYLECSPE